MERKPYVPPTLRRLEGAAHACVACDGTLVALTTTPQGIVLHTEPVCPGYDRAKPLLEKALLVRCM